MSVVPIVRIQRLSLGLLCLLVGSCCRGSLTEIMLVVDTDMESDIGSLGLQIQRWSGGPVGTPVDRSLAPGSFRWPVTLGILPQGDPTEAIFVKVTGIVPGSSGAVAGWRQAWAAFQPGQVVTLRMNLLRCCTCVACNAATDTCGDTCMCRSIEANADLVPWVGDPQRIDGGAEGCSADVPTDVPDDAPADRPVDPPPDMDAPVEGPADAPVDVPDACSSCGISSCCGSTTCCFGGICADLMNDPQHCGMCNRPCSMNETCVSGACVCPSPYMSCGVGCIDTSSDASNCGSCGTACPTNEACVSSSCVCSSPYALCGASCVDTRSDSSHCGSCSNSCTGGDVCCCGTCCIAASACCYAACSMIDAGAP